MAQEARTSTPAIMAVVCVIREKTVVALLLLEALGALLILVFIVWWTMFSGRKNGELKNKTPSDTRRKNSSDLL